MKLKTKLLSFKKSTNFLKKLTNLKHSFNGRKTNDLDYSSSKDPLIKSLNSLLATSPSLPLKHSSLNESILET